MEQPPEMEPERAVILLGENGDDYRSDLEQTTALTESI
jgi:hypothetical protein